MSKFNDKWINLVFCIDKSASMYYSKKDVIEGFEKIIKEQKANKDGKVTVSLYTFNEKVKQEYLGIDINDIAKFEYEPNGCTAMNDGIGTAIDEVGKWLYEKDKNDEELPRVTMFVVMTDGMENSSVEYTLKQVQDKIKEQTEVYSWQFIYQGVDVTTSSAAETLGFKYSTFSSRRGLSNNYDVINCAVSSYRKLASAGASANATMDCLTTTLTEETVKNTAKYEKELGRKISKV